MLIYLFISLIFVTTRYFTMILTIDSITRVWNITVITQRDMTEIYTFSRGHACYKYIIYYDHVNLQRRRKWYIRHKHLCTEVYINLPVVRHIHLWPLCGLQANSPRASASTINHLRPMQADSPQSAR